MTAPHSQQGLYYPPPQMRRFKPPANGFSIVALVLGIVAALTNFTGPFIFLLAPLPMILGVTFGLIGKWQTSKRYRLLDNIAIWGIILSVSPLMLALAGMVLSQIK